MKKRGFLCIVALFTVLLLVGCNSKPSDMSDTAYRAGNKAVEIAESYLNMDISQDDAYDQLGEVYDRMDAVDDSTESTHDLRVKIAILGLQLDLSPFSAKTAAGIEDAVEENVKQLKHLLKY